MLLVNYVTKGIFMEFSFLKPTETVDKVIEVLNVTTDMKSS